MAAAADDMSTTSSTSTDVHGELPLRSIPGSYGLPILGPFKDRLDYFWFQGPDTFFRKRIELHKSTVYRTNIPPTFPFFLGTNPNVVAVLDVKSFSQLFDTSLVDKKDVLVGDFMPSTSFTGGVRVLTYLDTAEPLHSSAKRLVIDMLHRSARLWEVEFLKEVDVMFDSVEGKVGSHGKASFLGPLKGCLFSFLCRSLLRADPAARPRVKKWGPFMVDAWLALQLIPTQYIGVIPQPLVEIFLHSFPFPACLTKWAYKSLYYFVESEGKYMVMLDGYFII